jgi:hypothetical protein
MGPGAVQAVADKMEQKSLVAQIHNFGQTPAQLFRRKHPKRAPLLPSSLPLLLQPKSALRLTMIGAPQTGHTVAALVHLAVRWFVDQHVKRFSKVVVRVNQRRERFSQSGTHARSDGSPETECASDG